MSLLHEALKKAERDGIARDLSKDVFVDSEERSKRSVVRIVVLGLLASAAILGFLYLRILKKPSASKPPAPVVGLTASGGGATMGRAELMEEALSLIKQEKFEEARGRLEKVLALSGTPTENAQAYNDLGFVLKKIGRNEEAFEHYRKALGLDPQCAECLNNLGVLYLSSRDLTEAEIRFRKAIEIKPEYADPYLHLALLLEARGDLDGAKKNYLKFAELAQGVGADFLAKVQERVSSMGSR